MPKSLPDTIAFLLSIAMAAFASVLLLLLLCFIWQYEVAAKQRVLTFKNIGTPFNISLSLIAASFIALYVCFAIAIQQAYDILDAALVSLFIQLCLGTIQFCYVFHSWQRSKFIIKRSAPLLHPIFGILIVASPVLFYAPVLTQLVLRFCTSCHQNQAAVDSLQFITPGIAGVSCAVFDSLFLWCFTRYIHSKNLDEAGQLNEEHPEFLTISFYGQITCITCYVAIAVYIVGVSAPVLAPVRNLMIVIANSFLMAGFLSLCGLKRALFLLGEDQGRRNSATLKRSIERAGRALSASSGSSASNSSR
ncbi:hypothetical protein HDU77_009918 [Chytriomyces hyalinus]|nr:hypothetical protein HDU77_009918 [Chytriomyces hyalinus]